MTKNVERLKPEDTPSRLLGVEAAAVYLSLSPAQIRKMAKENILKSVRMERAILFKVDDLNDWIESQQVNTAKGIVITIGNQKGGVTKTTTSINISYELCVRGYSILLIDLDPQASLSGQFGRQNLLDNTIYTMLRKFLDTDQNSMRSTILPTIHDTHAGGHEKLHIIAGDERLADIYNELSNDIRGQESLKVLLAPVLNDYDFIIFDTPPSRLDIAIQMPLVASDYVLLPHTPDKMTGEAIERFANLIQHVKQYRNKRLTVLGALIARYKNIDAHKYMVEQIGKVYDVFSSMISEKAVVQESQIAEVPLLIHNQANAFEVTEQYRALVTEILAKIKKG